MGQLADSYLNHLISPALFQENSRVRRSGHVTRYGSLYRIDAYLEVAQLPKHGTPIVVERIFAR